MKSAGRQEISPLAYFLDELPSELTLAGLPAEATNVVVAKVRATQTPTSLLGRHATLPLPRDRFFIRIKTLEVLRGNATVGEEHAIYFGEPARRLSFPLSPEQLGREYLVVIYQESSDAKRRLLGVSISDAQFKKWREEISDYRLSKKYKSAPKASEPPVTP